MDKPFEYSIEPPSRLPSINLIELWRYRDLFAVMAWRDISVRYKQTMLGVLWALVQPLVTMLIFSFVFNKLGHINSGDGTPYPVFLYSGLLFWQYYANTLANASNSLILNAAIVQKVYFPRLILPITASITSLVDMAVGAVVLAILMGHYGFSPRVAGIILLPLLMISAVLAATGVGLTLASLNVKYRDVRYALPFFIQTLMYVTPVIYPASLLKHHPDASALMLWLNPIAGVITVARASLLGNAPIEWTTLLISSLMSCIYFVLGLFFFRNTERYFADLV